MSNISNDITYGCGHPFLGGLIHLQANSWQIQVVADYVVHIFGAPTEKETSF